MNSKHQTQEYRDNKTKERFADVEICCESDDLLANETAETILRDYSDKIAKTTMTEKDMDNLRYTLIEGVAIQLSHEYEDEEDFEEKFGNTDTLEDAIDLYCRYKNDEDVQSMCNKWMLKFPNDKEYLLALFGLENN